MCAFLLGLSALSSFWTMVTNLCCLIAEESDVTHTTQHTSHFHTLGPYCVSSFLSNQFSMLSWHNPARLIKHIWLCGAAGYRKLIHMRSVTNYSDNHGASQIRFCIKFGLMFFSVVVCLSRRASLLCTLQQNTGRSRLPTFFCRKTPRLMLLGR